MKLRRDAGVYKLRANVRASTGPFRGRVRCRCIRYSCRTRWTLRKAPGEYVQPPKCKSCGAGLTIDFYRQRKAEVRKAGVCNCGQYWFPHRHNKGKAT
jgi:hypothetical protein